MPIKILFIEENGTKQEVIKLCLSQNSGIQYDIIADFNELDTALNSNAYTHLVAQSIVKNESVLAFVDAIELRLLVVNDAGLDLSGTSCASTKSPLTYTALFAFLVESTPVSYASMEEYAMDDEEFFEQLKGLMVDEFQNNFEEIPALIENKNVSELKSRAHQLSSKFAMLDLPLSALLCKEIDVNILNDADKQLENMKLLLVDLEIALVHLQ
jgi:HPt (histidine-containing phosphotransfer) domain-containing protein